MVDLRGKLEIYRLENVGSAEEARRANLNGKHGIKKLILDWRIMYRADRDAELEAAVLESLQPHTNLQELTLNYYGGFRIPSWMADPSFSQLTRLKLWSNRNIVFLLPLGRLPALEYLSLYELNGVRCIGHDFSCDSKVGFPSLKMLKFELMAEWEEWDGVQDGDFPHLQILYINYCPKLRRLPNIPLLRSQTLCIFNCDNLSSIPLQQNSGLQMLRIWKCLRLTSVMGLHNVDSLQVLDIRICPALPYFPGDLPSKLRQFDWKVDDTSDESISTSSEHVELDVDETSDESMSTSSEHVEEETIDRPADNLAFFQYGKIIMWRVQDKCD